MQEKRERECSRMFGLCYNAVIITTCILYLWASLHISDLWPIDMYGWC